MKIKYQSGGMLTYTPFIPNSGTTNTTSSSGSTEKQDKITGTLQKEIVDVLKENGIQSDVDTFLSQANAFLNKSQHLSSMALFGGSSDDYSMTDLIQVLSMANRVKQNKAYYDTAADRLKEQDAWNEIAVSTDGKIYVYSEEGLRTVSADEFHKNRDKYQALTNSQVLGLREQDSNMAFNINVLRDMSGALGLKTITTQLMDTVSKFGTMSRTEYTKNTGNAISQSAWDGMQILLGEGPQGYYKATTKSEKENVQSALRYLWSSLGTDGQARLRAETAANGLDPSKNQYDLLLQTIEHHTDFEQSVDFDKTSTEYDPNGDGKGDAKPQLEDDSYLSVIAKGKGIREQLSLTPSTKDPMGEQIGLKVWGINIGPLVDKNGNIIEQTSLPDALKRGEVFRGRPDNNVTFGNKVLTSEEQKTIITDENAIVYMVEMPYKETINGVVPDFSMVDVYEKVNKLLQDTTNNIQRTELLIQNGIDPSKLTVDEEGNWSLKTKLFTRVPGYISEDLTELTDDNKRFMDPVDESEGNQKRKLFNKILKYGIQNPEKGADAVHSTWNWFGGGDWDRGDMHRGYFYVTAPDEWIAALLTGQNKIDKHLLTDIDKRIYMSRAQQNSPLITQL